MTQPDLQMQARALGDPTRHTIFRLIAQSPKGFDVARLTAELDLNHNAIRKHLSKLVDAGLVTRRQAPVTGRGRPRQLYELHPAIESRWGGAGGPYLRLSLLLVEIIRSGDDPVEVGRRAGRVAELGALPDDDVPAALERVMTREGFDPAVQDEGELIEFVLRTCPFAETAAADPETICSLHLGLARGLAERFDRLAVDSLEPREPRQAGCRLRFHMEAAQP